VGGGQWVSWVFCVAKPSHGSGPPEEGPQGEWFSNKGSGPPEEGPFYFDVNLKRGDSLRGPALPTVRGAFCGLWVWTSLRGSRLCPPLEGRFAGYGFGPPLEGPGVAYRKRGVASGMGWLPKRPGLPP
jgi:hypothetical protein